MRRFLYAVIALVGIAGVTPALAGTATAASSFPSYNHVFLIIGENHNYDQIIGNPAAPEINALASDYGLATRYTGVGDPSEPNYVAMLGGSTFGINSDDPYFFPGQTVNQPNLMSQLEAAGKTWKGYFDGMPYAGYRGQCFPAKCNGIPDSDTLYASKHNGVVNFANMQTPAEFAKEAPYQQLPADLASGQVPNFSYIVPSECDDMHGAPPWCTDSGKAGDAHDNELVATGDAFVGSTVNEITSSSMWESGNNAIVVTFDEGNNAQSQIATIVVTNHGPRGVTDNTSYDHYNLLASLQQAFGLGCLQNSCNAAPMTPLFQVTGSDTVPTLPAPFTAPPNGNNAVSATGNGVKGQKVTLTCPGSGWSQVSSPTIGSNDNNLAAASAASSGDAWAVGSYIAASNQVLAAMAEHWDGSSWTEFPLPDVGSNQNSLLAVSELPSGSTWAAGYFENANWAQQALVEHWDGTQWSVIPAANPGSGDILNGVAALSDSDVWAVGAQQDSSGVFHPLAEHWNGSAWSVVPVVDPPGGGSIFYAIDAVSSSSVYAVGQTGTSFPSQALVEHWNGKAWSQLTSPADSTETLTTMGLTGSDSALTLVGDRETSTAPATTEVAAGAPASLALASTPNNGTGENFLFSAATAADGSVYAAGWYLNTSLGAHQSLIEHGVNGQWSIDTTPNPGSGDTGFAGVTAIPGGGLWAVGVSSGTGNFSTFIAHHC